MHLPLGITNALLRRRAAFHKIPLGNYQIRIARTTDEYTAAFRLLHYAYVFQGIESVRAPERRITPQHLLPEATVFVAYAGSSVVGTCTVTVDSPAKLPLDKDYGAALDRLRTDGATLAEIGSLAVVQSHWHTGVTQLLSLAATSFAFEHAGATHTVIGINPKAAPFYRAVWGFRDLGRSQGHAHLRAPVIGMVNERGNLHRLWTRAFRRPMQTGHRPIAHLGGKPCPTIAIPPRMSPEVFARWKMPRAVFRELFVDAGAIVPKLDHATQAYLGQRHSRATLRLLHEEAS